MAYDIRLLDIWNDFISDNDAHRKIFVDRRREGTWIFNCYYYIFLGLSRHLIDFRFVMSLLRSLLPAPSITKKRKTTFTNWVPSKENILNDCCLQSMNVFNVCVVPSAIQKIQINLEIAINFEDFLYSYGK